MKAPGRIVVLYTHAMGNALHVTPALRALRRTYPGAAITFVGDSAISPLFENSPDVNRVIAVGKRPADVARALPSFLRIRRPDILLDMRTNPRTFVWALLIGGRRRIGCESRRGFLYTDRVPRFPSERLILYEPAQLLKPLGITLQAEDRWLRLVVRPEERDAARKRLAEVGCDADRPYALLQLTFGSDQFRARHRRWLPERFAALSDWLQEDRGFQVVVTSLNADEEMLVKVRSLVRRPFVDLSGRTPLRALIAVVEGAALYTGYETGPMHLAAALDVPIAAISEVPAHRESFRPVTHAPYRLVPGGPLCSGPCCASPEPGRDWCLQPLEATAVQEAIDSVLAEAIG